MRRLFLLAFIWGWSFLFIKVILEDAPPTFLAWGRIVLGLAVLAVAAGPAPRAPARAPLLGAPGGPGPDHERPAVHADRLGRGAHQLGPGLGPERLHTTVRGGFAAGLLGERLRPPQLAGIAIGFLGVAVVAGVGGGDLGGSLLGSAAVVLAGAGYGFGFAYANRFTTGLRPPASSASCWPNLSPPSPPSTCRRPGRPRPHGRPLPGPAGHLGTGYAYLLNYRTLQESGATVASLVTYLPLVAVAAGVLVLGEPFSIRLVIGGLVVVAGVALVQGRLFGPRRVPQPVPETATCD